MNTNHRPVARLPIGTSFQWLALGLLASNLMLARAADFDLSRDYSPTINPSAPWSYGAKPSLNGPFSLFTIRGTAPADGGVPIQYWQLLPLREPTIFHNGTTITATIGGGQGTLPPGTTYLISGTDGLSNGFGAVRFTAPVAGAYTVQASARPLYNTSLQGDTDYHIVRNGAELFGRFLAGQQSASYSNVVALAAGDTLDFMVGRGADNSGFASGLKIEAWLTVATNVPPPPPPPPSSDYDLSRDYSPTVNPSAPWSYGAKPSLNGPLSLFTIRGTTPADGGIPIQYWQLIPLQEPTLFHNGTTTTATIGGGQGTLPPGTTYLISGTDGLSNGFGAVRFTAPAAGNYSVRASARPLWNTSLQGDTDYHIVRNGAELFGRFLAGQQTASYSNVVALAAGDTLDFMVGRGADNSGFASGLKIDAALTLVTNLPPPANCLPAALGLLAGLIEAVEMLESPVNINPLLASLRAAEASFRRGSLASGIGQLHAFQNKVRAEVERADATLAGHLIARAQEIIDAANCAAQAVALRVASLPLRVEYASAPVSDGFTVAFFGMPGAGYEVLVSENLADWRSVGLAVEIATGVFAYLDVETPGVPARFYRAVLSAEQRSKVSPVSLREDALVE